MSIAVELRQRSLIAEARHDATDPERPAKLTRAAQLCAEVSGIGASKLEMDAAEDIEQRVAEDQRRQASAAARRGGR